MVRGSVLLAYTVLASLLIVASGWHHRRYYYYERKFGRISSMAVQAKFSEHEVVPDVIPVAPSQAAEVCSISWLPN